MKQFEQVQELHFLSLIYGMQEKIRIVITFIALLELVKTARLGIKESENFNDFVIIKL
jgi:segregation and condensation protein A